MPLREMSRLETRIEMVRLYETGLVGVTELAGLYGVSRETVYYWARRKAAGGERWFEDMSRAPHGRPQALDGSIVEAVLGLRRRFPWFGPKKLVAKLQLERPEIAWPSASTAGLWLKQAGLVKETVRRRRPLAQAPREAEAVEPNDEWAMDFKGWFRTSSGERCDPVTVSDAVSRRLLALRIVEPTLAGVKAVLEEVFGEAGLPLALRSDNGPPFGSAGAGGLSRLSVWLLKLGVEPRHIRPGKPQDNGRHERMHRTLKEQTACPPAADKQDQQRRFDCFRRHYNEERPHEALGQHVPASRWRPSPRTYTGCAADPWYDAEHEVRRVRSAGEIKWKGRLIFIGEALAGELIGLAEDENGGHRVRFATRQLGILAPDFVFRRYAGPPWRPASAAEHKAE
jgi:transposase InsO family protein